MNNLPTYLLVFGKEYTKDELALVADIPTSIYDNKQLAYTSVVGFDNKNLTNMHHPYHEFCYDMVKNALDPITDKREYVYNREIGAAEVNPDYGLIHKNYQYGIIPPQLIDSSFNSKARSNLHNRSMILLDFDAMGDKTWQDIEQLLSQYQYFAWTTFNDQVAGKGRRYRVMMMLAETYKTAAEWECVKSGFINWMITNGFVVDPTGTGTFEQLGICPVINPAIGKITFFRNDGELISLQPFYQQSAPAKLTRKTSSIGSKKYEDTDSSNVAYANKDIVKLLKTEEDKNKFAELLVSVCGSHLLVDVISPDNKMDLKIGDRAGFGLNNVIIKTPNGFIKTKIGSAKLIWAIRSAITNRFECNKYFADIWAKVNRKDYCVNTVLSKANEPNTGITTQGITDLIEISGIGGKLGLQQSPRTSIKDYRTRMIREMHGHWEHVEATTDGYLPAYVLRHSEGDFVALQAGTGSGKTYSNKMLGHLVGVPYKSIESQYSDDGVIDNVVVFDNLYHKANNNNFGTIVADEVHDLAYMSYRPKAFGFVSEATAHQWDKLAYTPAMILQSGTIYYSDIKSVYESAKRLGNPDIKFKAYKLDKPLRKTTYQVVLPISSTTEENEDGEIEVKSKSYTDQIIELIQAGIDEQQLVYVIRNDQKENDKVADLLNNMGIGAISVSRDAINKAKQIAAPASDIDRPKGVIYVPRDDINKSKQIAAPATDIDRAINDFYNNADFLQKSHTINGNPLSVILATVIGVEGVNIKDEVDSARVIVVGELPESYVKQSQGRYRLAKSVQLIHFFFRQDIEWCDWLKDMTSPKPVVEDRLKRFDILADAIDRVIESGADVSAMGADVLARYGYYKCAGKIKESVYKPLIRAGIKNDFDFYQSISRMETNMEVWGCVIDDAVELTYDENVSIKAKEKAAADAIAKIEAKKKAVQSLIDSAGSIGGLVSLVENSSDPVISGDIGLTQLIRFCANGFVCPIEFIKPDESGLFSYNFKNKCNLTFDEFVEAKRKEFDECKNKPTITDVGTNNTGKITKRVVSLIMKYIENKLDINYTDWNEKHNAIYLIPGMIDFVNTWYNEVAGKPSADELRMFIRAFTKKLINYYTCNGTNNADPIGITRLICDSWYRELATVCDASGTIIWRLRLHKEPKIWFAQNSMMVFGEKTSKMVMNEEGESTKVNCYPIIR